VGGEGNRWEWRPPNWPTRWRLRSTWSDSALLGTTICHMGQPNAAANPVTSCRVGSGKGPYVQRGRPPGGGGGGG
jgi:hypothetical protein